jgi:hypothetical protein
MIAEDPARYCCKVSTAVLNYAKSDKEGYGKYQESNDNSVPLYVHSTTPL